MTVHPLLSMQGIEQIYTIGEKQVGVLHGIDLEVHDGEFLVVFGQSGSGKSALLNIIAGIEPSTRGTMLLAGEHMGPAPHGGHRLSPHISFLSPVFSLNTKITIREAVHAPGIARKIDPDLALEMAGIKQNDNRRIEQLDPETRRRVGCARAFLSRPRMILADMSPPPWGVKPPLEPLMDANEELGSAIILTTESPISVVGSRQLKMAHGRIISGTVDPTADNLIP